MYRFLLISHLLVFAFLSNHAQADNVVTAEQLSSAKSLLNNYCVGCHNTADDTANLNLEDFDFAAASKNDKWNTSAWEKIVKRLRAGQMPPADAQQPPEDLHSAALQQLENALNIAGQQHPMPGRTESIRRLNRTEYRNVIRDLLAVDVDVNSLLPADQSGHGFDNVTVGELPPVLLNRYITAAERIAGLAVGGPMRGPAGRIVRLPADMTQEQHVAGLPLGTRGGTVFQHQFPASGEYEIQLRLMRDRDEKIEGLNAEYKIDVLLDRNLAHQFTVFPPKKGTEWANDFTHLDSHLKKRFNVNAGPHQVGVTFPQTSASLSANARQPFEVSFNRHRHPRSAPALYEVSIVGPFNVPAAEAADNATSDNVATAASPNTERFANVTPSRRLLFTCYPQSDAEAEACATKILQRLLRLAYRRPVTAADLTVPLNFFKARLVAEESADGRFEAAIESALAAVLVNPHFLFKAEADPPAAASGTVYQISDLELASRLSFFLWSSMPDDELLTLAETDQLHEHAVLNAQVQRMLKDDRSQSLVTNFAAQWLYLRNLDSFRPDMRLYPNFDDNLRQALRTETEMLFEYVMKEDRSILELINSDTTFLNERLAKHYGIAHVFGSHFRPVNVAEAGVLRGGLLRHGSILTVTSYANRTSPTIRGNWILENILGTPPPPPPANVPSLKDKSEQANLTVRERLAEHRANPACASCHNLMDPIGFALEHFDAVGQYRQFEDEQPIDSSGSFPDGSQISSVQQLEQSIMQRPEMFVGTVAEKMLTFALGRGIETWDGPAIRKIVHDTGENGYRFSSLIIGIVQSTPFQKRVVE
ncbi:MAG: DUF1592 domain-containing protein [Fuerstiella sp.]